LRRVPAKVICSLDDYLARHRERITQTRQFPWTEYNAGSLTPWRLRELLAALEKGPAYITGGFSEEMKGQGGTERTPFDHTAEPNGMQYLKKKDQ